jgi:hypothetical protein
MDGRRDVRSSADATRPSTFYKLPLGTRPGAWHDRFVHRKCKSTLFDHWGRHLDEARSAVETLFAQPPRMSGLARREMLRCAEDVPWCFLGGMWTRYLTGDTQTFIDTRGTAELEAAQESAKGTGVKAESAR